MKYKIISILYELYALHRSINSRSSYGFFNAIQSLKSLSNRFIATHINNLSETVYYIGNNIQQIIDDYLIHQYTRIFNDRLKVYKSGKLNIRYYDVYSNGNYICKRLNIDLLKRYLKILGIKFKSIKYGKGYKKDPNHLKYGVGSITISCDKLYIDKYLDLLSDKYILLKLSKKSIKLIRNDYSSFIINIKIK